MLTLTKSPVVGEYLPQEQSHDIIEVQADVLLDDEEIPFVFSVANTGPVKPRLERYLLNVYQGRAKLLSWYYEPVQEY